MIFLSVFLLGFALSTSANLSYKNDFEAFERKFNKKYETPEERLNRFNIFQNNVKEIEAFNEGSHSWKKGINQFTDMTKDEFKARYYLVFIITYSTLSNRCTGWNKSTGRKITQF